MKRVRILEGGGKRRIEDRLRRTERLGFPEAMGPHGPRASCGTAGFEIEAGVGARDHSALPGRGDDENALLTITGWRPA